MALFKGGRDAHRPPHLDSYPHDVLLSDSETVHNTFPDEGFAP
jgi:hypothetical protein